MQDIFSSYWRCLETSTARSESLFERSEAPQNYQTSKWRHMNKAKAHIYHPSCVAWTQHFWPFSPEPQVIWISILRLSHLGARLLSCADFLSVTMRATDSSVICFHLQVLHGITVKSVERRKDRLFISGTKVFGVPLESLPRRYIPEFGLVPWWVGALASQGLSCFIGAEQQLRREPCLCCVSAFWWMRVRFFWTALGL